jgi:septal ring factor EnvC (AmiA/AmiB activator)
MSSSITDIESGITKIEALMKSLREDRDKSQSEVSEIKRLLEERELDLLQAEEEREKERRGFEEELSEERKARENLEEKLSELAARINSLMPLVAEYARANSEAARISSDDRT